MESNTRPLEMVCRYFRRECGDKTIDNLLKRLNRAHVANHRLRKKALQLEAQVILERSCRALLNNMLIEVTLRMDSLLAEHSDRIADE